MILAETRTDAERLKTAINLGIDHVTDDLSENTLLSLTGAPQANVAIDCSGAGSAVNMGLSLLTAKELSINGFFGHRWHNWEQALTLMRSGKIRLQKLITGRYPLERWKEAFEQMQQQRGIKTLLIPSD